MTKKQYIEHLKNLIGEDENYKTDKINETIYIIDDIMVNGDFFQGYRGVDHNVLMVNGVTWYDLIEWGTIIIPETRLYISDQVIQTLKNIGYENIPTNNNHIVGYRQQPISRI